MSRAQPCQERCPCGARGGATAYLAKGAAGRSYGLRVCLRERGLQEARGGEGVVQPVPGPFALTGCGAGSAESSPPPAHWRGRRAPLRAGRRAPSKAQVRMA